ncbi:transposable element Tcb2 transposase [Trichonephila clavipes]|nr:transposable element Tcb2 transposase [Trichonephila clavipes]
MLGRRIAARQPPPTYLTELRRALLDEWCNIPQDQIDNLILSMPRRSAFVIKKEVGCWNVFRAVRPTKLKDKDRRVLFKEIRKNRIKPMTHIRQELQQTS